MAPVGVQEAQFPARQRAERMQEETGDGVVGNEGDDGYEKEGQNRVDDPAPKLLQVLDEGHGAGRPLTPPSQEPQVARSHVAPSLRHARSGVLSSRSAAGGPRPVSALPGRNLRPR